MSWLERSTSSKSSSRDRLGSLVFAFFCRFRRLGYFDLGQGGFDIVDDDARFLAVIENLLQCIEHRLHIFGFYHHAGRKPFVVERGRTPPVHDFRRGRDALDCLELVLRCDDFQNLQTHGSVLP